MRNLIIFGMISLVIGALVACSGKKSSTAKQETSINEVKSEADSTIITDVVCSMVVDTNKTKIISYYKGEKYYFCSNECKAKFDANPAEYFKKPADEPEGI